MTVVESAILVTESQPPLQLEMNEGVTKEQHEVVMAHKSDTESTQPESSEPVDSSEE